MLQPIYDRKIRRIADKSLTNCAIDLGSRGWLCEQIWSQQGRWSFSKLWTYDCEKSQEVANRSYMNVRRVANGRNMNCAWSWVDKSCDWSGDWLGDHVIGCASCGTVSRVVVRYIRIRDDWLHDLNIGRATSRHLLVVSYYSKWACFWNNIRYKCSKIV